MENEIWKENCILWNGPKWAQGRYGVDRLNKKQISAHRAAWIRKYGEIPMGLLVCHKCDNGLCVNPDHLFLGTHKDNTQDCMNKGRMTDQKGINNNNARPDYYEIRVKAKNMRILGFSLSKIRIELGIKSNGHLVKLLK
jgi:hypothetical protein